MTDRPAKSKRLHGLIGLVLGFALGLALAPSGAFAVSAGSAGFAGAAVLYDTSNIMHHYPSDRYVAAAMALFASIALMFWYVLRLFMSRD